MGMLHPLHQGVYALGHTALAPLAREQAALLACGSDAILSHGTAAHLWGLVDRPPSLVDVVLVGRQCRRKDGIRIRRVEALHPGDLRRRDGLPLTAPARTLIDLAQHVTPDDLERLVSEARAQRLVNDRELDAALARAGRRRGVVKMRAFLEAENEPDFTRSKGERTLQRYLRRARLPQPRANARVGRWLVDFLWPAEKLVVEFDGYQFHSHRRAFERDRRKDVELVNAGYVVLRFTWRQLRDEPLVVIAAIAQALGRLRAPA